MDNVITPFWSTYDNWEEDKHKRDEHGRFSSTGTSRILGKKSINSYIKTYENKHPNIKKDAKQYVSALKIVKNIYNTQSTIKANSYDFEDIINGNPPSSNNEMHSNSGYCVTFNQASQGKNPFEYYDDHSYAKMIAILKNECKSSKLQIGIFGGVPEVSVICDDYKTAYDFGFLHNQNSIFDNKLMSETGNDTKATVLLRKNGKGYNKYYNNV